MSALQRTFEPQTRPSLPADRTPPRTRRSVPGGPLWAAGATALLLQLLWARFLAGVGGDLAAQWAWADFAARHPGSAYDLAWYGGMHPASYSVLAPYLMALLGVRTVAVASGTASAVLLALLVTRARVRRPYTVVLWGAFALSCNIAAGRVTFALGTAFALAALALAGTGRALGGRRAAGVAALALAATLGSPVAGLFVEVAAAALLLTGRRRTGWTLAVPPPLVVLATTALFPFGGIDPITVSTVVFCVATALAVAVLTPGRWRAARAGALLYAVGSVLTWVFATPIGANVQRLALLFGSVLLLAALCAAAPRRPGAAPRRRPGAVPPGAVPTSGAVPCGAGPTPGAAPRPAPAHGSVRLRRWRTAALLVAFAATAYWTVGANLVGIPAPSSPAQAAPLIAELRRLHADRGRLEAVPMRNHWEAQGLVTAALLARGWNRQLDVERNHLFYDGPLTAAAYHAWLRHWAVLHVALPNAATDVAATAEAAVVRSGPSWLREVWHDRYWRLYRVTDAPPLAGPSAEIVHADAARLAVKITAPGQVTVRVRWSPWLAVHGPSGACLAPAGDWTRVEAPAPGVYRIDAPYLLPRGTPCDRG